MSSVEPAGYGDEVNGGEKIACRLIIAGGDGAEVLELIEEPLDEIAFTIESEIRWARLYSVGLGWNDWVDPPLLESLNQGVGVISLVRQEGFRLYSLQQWLGLAEVGGLAWRQREGDGVTQRID